MSQDKKRPSLVWDVFQLETFVELAWGGLQYGANAVEIAKALHRCGRNPGKSPKAKPDLKDALRKARKVEKFAKPQLEKGFPYLYALASTRLWTILELDMEGFVYGVVSSVEEVRNRPALMELDGPLLPFANSQPEEQAEILVSLLLDKTQARLKPGVGRFEAVLNVVGLGGPIHSVVRRNLLELSSVRNLIVHKNSIVDRRFLETCPWHESKEGDELLLGIADFDRYVSSCRWYLLEVGHRRITRYPPTIDGDWATPESLASLRDEIGKRLDDRGHAGMKH